MFDVDNIRGPYYLEWNFTVHIGYLWRVRRYRNSKLFILDIDVDAK